ncbi:DUF2971 domain-containing protein [Aeromonas hydrophila]|uniref:DUF2971 domain-containing protein n=1 Tax=Aeromonas hydrophila TaxID=644 RepID=UPI0024424CCC|nr:DUF2971 domain-containing protein [Aeromonas hydrophila]
MLLYKYRSIDDLWRTLDIILNHRVWCSSWDALNDPLEGRYEAFFGSKFIDKVNKKRNEWRICALSESIDNFLLWSHYAAGHKGIAIEIEISETHQDLAKITYSPFSPLFTEVSESNLEQRHLFEVKSKEWMYEEEFRIICKEEYFKLPNPIRKIYIGPKVPLDRVEVLKSILPKQIELVMMEVDMTQGKVVPKMPNKALK